MTLKCLCGVVDPYAQGAADRPLRTIDLSNESGYSVQQVRDLERLGVIPPAIRERNGYRTFTRVHLETLKLYRRLAEAAGPVAARRVLGMARHESRGAVFDAVARLHVVNVRARDETIGGLSAIRRMSAESEERAGSRSGSEPGGGGEVAEEQMTITEFADALGVRTSTLRFWEREGLIHPERIGSQRARLYPPGAVGEGRLVAALRAAGQGIPAVRATMTDLGRGADITTVAALLERRLDLIATRTAQLLRLGADLVELFEEIQSSGSPGGAEPPKPSDDEQNSGAASADVSRETEPSTEDRSTAHAE
ncbi:MerR family transcriptional regulator [Nakamurella sp. YIM 132087]|uniref:MerR family transcriptional regulator n=1 Tax=Nakamurella alba TaxID=2665158 RepID=A0A7K1FNV4_9ACTN|nr:MerR family transcriptional regulator [Nakamurella alba]MTD14989.1 MerR family transcriptional regulator [Nakamurella alba]